MSSTFSRIGLRRRALACCVPALVLGLAACSQSSQPVSQDATAKAASAAPAAVAQTPASPAAAFTAYAAAIPEAISNKQCAMDTINGQPAQTAASLAANSTATFSGWAGNGSGQAETTFELVLKGAQSYAAQGTANGARPDVAKALSSDGMVSSGYNLTASLAGVAAGSYTAYIVSPADPTNACVTQRTITVQ